MTLADVHSRLANTALYFLGIMALWGLWRFFRKQDLDSSYWGALAIGEVLVILQSALGAYLWITGARPGRGAFHILYGVVAILIIPAVYVYTKGDEKFRAALIYGVALLFGVGIVLRAIATGI